MRFLRRASSFLNNMRSDDSGSGVVSKTISFISGFSLVPIISVGLSLFVILIIALVLITTFSYKINLFQFVDLGNSSNVAAGNAIYDVAALEDYVKSSDEAYVTGNIPSVDLASTEYKSVSGFNDYMKKTICKAGYGTREGVVAAGMSLIGDYIKATGKRLRYSQPGRQQPGVDGIVNSDFYLDCSGFTCYSLYNGGFNLPDTGCETGSIYNWAVSNGIAKDPKSGGAGGDFLVTRGKGHIVLIVGSYDGGYYVAEEDGEELGGIVQKRSFENLSTNNYALVDMSKYYSDSKNVRTDGRC